MSRRDFFARTAQAVGAFTLAESLDACGKTSSFPGSIVGANASLGHRLHTMDFGPVAETIKTDIVIVGGGIAGLSAARYLHKQGNDFLLLEMAEQAGGNAAAGSNKVSAFPWGAHYLPLPGNGDMELISFLKEANVISGIRNGLPVYNEYYLCHDPKERLFIHNYWQEGLIPHEGLPLQDRDEIRRFTEMMHEFKSMQGDDHKPAFTIPLTHCSRDAKFLALDTINAETFLRQQNFISPYLNWYVNYCCSDDYGTTLRQTSAWAMIHYFTSRRGLAANATSDAVLTWPEGNFWLVKQLKKTIENEILSDSLVYNVTLTRQGVDVLFFDAARNVSKKLEAKKVIMATPQFINQRLLASITRDVDYHQFEYAPWMVANITTTHPLNEERGEPLCWDNVIYGSSALGYVNARHQQVGRLTDENVITYYKPLLSNNITTMRREAYSKTFDHWKGEVMADLKKAHKEIEKYVQEMNVWLWGHGMVKPGPGFIWSRNREQAGSAVDNKIFFAHSDLSGISIFEEAFYQGYTAAKAVLNHA